MVSASRFKERDCVCVRVREREREEGGVSEGAREGAREGGSDVKRFRGGLVFKAHRLLYYSTLGLRVMKKERGTPG